MMAYPYENTIDPASLGMQPNLLAKVVNRFMNQQSSGVFPGGQMVVRRNGSPAVNVAIGIARGFRPIESISPVKVQTETAFPVLSAGKPLGAIVIAALED